MIFGGTTYSVLVVSSSEQFVSFITPLLPKADYYPVRTVKTAGEARRIANEIGFDIILINAPLHDEFGNVLASDLSEKSNAGVLLFVKNELYEDIYSKVIENGVMVIGKPVPGMMVAQTLRMMCAARERMRMMEKKQASVEEKISEIRLVNRAKWQLISSQDMTEEDAHHYIEKLAMDKRISRKDAALVILGEQ